MNSKITFFIVYLILMALLTTACSSGVVAPPGPMGPAGPQGPSGDTGAPGRDGNDGAPGRDGRDGNNGVDGSNGRDGASCSIATLDIGSPGAPNGGALITCPDGTSTIIANGLNGSNGTNGVDGHDGASGTIITPVQFCRNFHQAYPSTFAEAGICINNVMYGVYSANGGFLAELPPGQYYSNGINASCTFTLLPNCQVSR